MQSVAKHLCYNQSFYKEQLPFGNDKENHFYQLFSEFIHQLAIKFRLRKSLEGHISYVSGGSKAYP